jgi:DNA-binding response OmpR family regulator
MFCYFAVMSKEDSVSTVYKCMLRGAADYLVKPIRRNELRNLWQHVWRRQSVCLFLTVLFFLCYVLFLKVMSYHSQS